MNTRPSYRVVALVALITVVSVVSARLRADTGMCGGVNLPFIDVSASNPFFCSIASAYFSGLSDGTTATTFGPADLVPREQMAAFVTRTMDQSLRRGSQRAVAQQWWQPTGVLALALSRAEVDDSHGNQFHSFPTRIAWDGADLWVTSRTGLLTVSRVRASDGRLLENWDMFIGGLDIIAAAGRIFVSGDSPFVSEEDAGRVFVIDPRREPTAASEFAKTKPHPNGLTFTGTHLWTANRSGSITRISLIGGFVSTFTSGFSSPFDILWDGENLWVADIGDDRLKRVDPANGAVLQSIPVGSSGPRVKSSPWELLFDGSNLWVSTNLDDSVTVVRAVGDLRGRVLATLTGNGLNGPRGMAFDGERVLVVNAQDSSVSLFKVADFTPLGRISVGPSSGPHGACSDGLNFWITRENSHDIVRF
ncbi:MAG TPA: hypothetical protein VGV87_22730 [Blastocatellia bacterium]|jgi:DNA-binding beta-propeller fold protein YncE|nr:hypothetical protein [Blastocatellia bacterium]